MIAFADGKGYLHLVLFRSIILTLVVALQLVSMLSTQVPAMAAMHSDGERTEATVAQKTLGESIASQPVRIVLSAPRFLPASVDDRRPCDGFQTRSMVRTNDVPSHLAMTLHVTFLRHSVLLI